MSIWTAEATNARQDSVNFNILVDIVYTDDSKPPRQFVDKAFPVGVVSPSEINGKVAEQARKRIRNVFEPSDLALAALVLGPITLPPDPTAPMVTPEQQAVIDANLAFQKAFKDAQVAQLAQASPAVQTAYDALTSAQAAVPVKP